MSTVSEIWSAVCSTLKSTLSDKDAYENYIICNEAVSIDDSVLTLAAENSFLINFLEANYKKKIIEALMIVTGKNYNVVWIERPITGERESVSDVENTSLFKDFKLESQSASEEIRTKPSAAKVQGVCLGSLNPDFTFEEFVVGPSNSFTHAAAKAVAENPGTAYNPLFIYGDTGLGKTHLMQAVGHSLLMRGKTVAYVTTEMLLNEYTEAIRLNQTTEFRNKYRKVDLLMVDDIQFLANKKGIQEEFFHTFNDLYQNHKQIILTSDRPAMEVSGLEARLVSRFNAGLAVEMETPNFEMRLSILRYKQMRKPIKLTEAEEIFIAENVKSNVRTLEGAVNRAIAFKSISTVPPTIEGLRAILHDLISEEASKEVTQEDIRKVVSEYYNVSVDDLNKDSRLSSIVMPRQVAMYLCRVLTKNSLPAIAKTFARTHANVYHACSKMQQEYKKDDVLRRNIIMILQKLGKDPSCLETGE